jgi:hypothetical protein
MISLASLERAPKPRDNTCGGAYRCCPPDAVSQHTNTKRTVIFCRAVVQGFEINGVFERTVFDKISFGYRGVVLCYAHRKA